jgi:hypothetical protein
VWLFAIHAESAPKNFALPALSADFVEKRTADFV